MVMKREEEDASQVDMSTYSYQLITCDGIFNPSTNSVRSLTGK